MRKRGGKKYNHRLAGLMKTGTFELLIWQFFSSTWPENLKFEKD